MARLPSFADLSGPVSLRSGRQYASADETAAGRGLSALGQGIESLGASLQSIEAKKKNDTLALEGTSADGNGIRDLNDFERSFDQDSDYAGYEKKWDAGVAQIRNKWAATITDPKARQIWASEFDKTSNPARNRVLDLREKGIREQRLVSAKSGLEGYQSIIADPDATDEDRTRARKSADASISALHDAGDLSPAEASDWRDKIIHGGDFVYGERQIEANGAAAISGKLPASVSDRANAAMGFYQSRGYTKEQAAGIVGNLIAESKLQPSGAIGDKGTAFGIAQWRGDRLTKLKRFAAAHGKSWQDFETQLAFVDAELQDDEPAAYQALKKATTVDEATAAFIGFERPRGWTADNPRAGHNYKGRLTFAAQAAGETIKPDWFTSLPPDQQFQLEQRASAQQREMDNAAAAQTTAAQSRAMDDFNLRIAVGDPKLTPDEILNSSLIDNGGKATLLNSWNAKNKEQVDTAAAIQQFSAGNLAVDPFDEKGRKTVDSVYDASVKAVAPEQVQPLTEELVRQTGVVPKGAMNGIRAGIQSTDVATVTQSLDAAQRLATINPAALGRSAGGNEVQSAVDDYRHFVNDLNLSPEQAAARVKDAQDPAKRLARKAIEPAAKEFVKSMQDFDLAGAFNDSWFGGDPSLGFTPSQSLGIKADFLAIAEDQFYQANGDPDLAKARALEEMKRLYGVTTFGGANAVVKHPPDRYWPKSSFGAESRTTRIGGSGGQGPGNAMGGSEAAPSLDYARQQLQADVAAFAKGSATPEGEFKGILEKGNIDLSARPVVKNADGTISTVRSMSFEEDGKEVLIPTVSPDGKILSDDDAIKLYRQTGQFLGKFDNPDDADAYAQALHESQARFYGGDGIDPATIQLVTTPETDAQVKRGELPGYAVLYKDKDGTYQTIPGKLWRPDISKAVAVNAEKDAAEKAETERGARIIQDVERGKAEQVNRPSPTPEQVMTPPTAQDILSGNDPVFGAR